MSPSPGIYGSGRRTHLSREDVASFSYQVTPVGPTPAAVDNSRESQAEQPPRTVRVTPRPGVDLPPQRRRRQRDTEPHRNAPLTETGRLRLARCVVDDGWPLRRAAERFQVSPTTASRWPHRYRELGEAGMADRSSRPRVSPRRTPTRIERRIIKVRLARRWGPARIAGLLHLNASTVHRVLTRYGLARLAHLDRPTGRVIRRYERAAPASWCMWTSRNWATYPTAAATKPMAARSDPATAPAAPRSPTTAPARAPNSATATYTTHRPARRLTRMAPPLQPSPTPHRNRRPTRQPRPQPLRTEHLAGRAGWCGWAVVDGVRGGGEVRSPDSVTNRP
jgi:transposase